MRTLGLVMLILFSSQSYGYLNPENFESNQTKHKVLIFLSQKCPCSQSHVKHLNDLSKKKDIQFFGVITDKITPENKDQITGYFTEKQFQFPIINDQEHVLVKKYSALKTPHVTILEGGSHSKVIYQGGVSNHRFYSQSTKKFLEENVNALTNNQKLVYERGPSLGCYIRRI